MVDTGHSHLSPTTVGPRVSGVMHGTARSGGCGYGVSDMVGLINRWKVSDYRMAQHGDLGISEYRRMSWPRSSIATWLDRMRR